MDQSGIFRIPETKCKNGSCATAQTRNVTPWSSVFNPTPTTAPSAPPVNSNRFYQIDPFSNFKRSDSILADTFPGMRFKENIPKTRNIRTQKQ